MKHFLRSLIVRRHKFIIKGDDLTNAMMVLDAYLYSRHKTYDICKCGKPGNPEWAFGIICSDDEWALIMNELRKERFNEILLLQTGYYPIH